MSDDALIIAIALAPGFMLAVAGLFVAYVVAPSRRARGTRYRLRVRYYGGLRRKWGFTVAPIAEDPARDLAPIATGRRRTRATATMAARWKARRHARAKRLEARSWEWEVRR